MRCSSMNAFMLTALLYTCAGSVTANEPEAIPHGFLVFSSHGIANYALTSQRELHRQGSSSTGHIDDFIAKDGHLYRMDKLPGKISELGADLAPQREMSVKSTTGIPYWLGVWDEGLLVLNDNTVIYIDTSLHEIARILLDPHRHGQITPVLSPGDFDVSEHNGYLLTNSGEVFVVPLQRPISTAPLKAAFRVTDGLTPDGQWIDPTERTLNLIARTRHEEYDAKLKPGERRLVEQQLVLSYQLDRLSAPALETVVHEKCEIRMPVGLDADNSGRPDGIVYERKPPPYRPDGPATGTLIGIISRTTPAYAEAFIEDGPLPHRSIVRLMSRGRYQVQTLQGKQGEPRWFVQDKARLYVDGDLGAHVLRLQPEPYQKLDALPELKDVYFQTIAY